MAKKNKNIILIDSIPKYSQQPRSSPPKRRTDFSIFFNPDSSLDSSSGTHRLSTSAASSLQERKLEVKQFPEDTEVDSAVQDESLSPGSNSNSLAATPGSVVWARTASQMWWPAEVMEEGSTLSDPAHDGHVFVQFYENHSSAWVDPMTDISAFEESFEERSTNPSKDFKKALKQALQRKEQLSSCRSSSSDRYSHCNQRNHSSDKRTSCTSSTIKDDFKERRRGKRERKRKVHFDEVTFKPKSENKSRRLKIMRYLGLVAPVGSPF